MTGWLSRACKKSRMAPRLTRRRLRPRWPTSNPALQRRKRSDNPHHASRIARYALMYRFFINRPIVAMVIAILMVLVGVISMLTLPISQFPQVVPPEIRIQTTFVGADAETVQQSVATPIEEQM